MAEIKYTYKDKKHRINSYDEIIRTYDWIRDALQFVFQDEKEVYIRCNIAFSTDEMSYECSSNKKNKKYAFGKVIDIERILVYVTKDWVGSLVDVYTTNIKSTEEQEYHITSKDEMLIINLRDALRSNRKRGSREKETVVMKIEDNSVHIGNGNTISNSVIGSKNRVENEQENNPIEGKDEKWYSKTFWQILIPLAVTVIGAGICALLGFE